MIEGVAILLQCTIKKFKYTDKVDVGIMGHLSSSVNFLGCDYWKKARFMVLHNKDMEILKIKLFQ